MREFCIYGAITDGDADKESPDDVSLVDFSAFASTLKPGDTAVFRINSPGGSVTGGIAMANKIKRLSQDGVKTVAVVEGLCASIATVLMCACDVVRMYETSFVMIHNAWTVVQGDSNALRREADTIEKMNDAILSFYRSKFDLTDQQLKSFMDAETWFSGAEAESFGLRCEVVKSDAPMRAVASIKNFKYKNIPRNFMMDKNKNEELPCEEKKLEEPAEQLEAATEETTEETTEQTVEQPKEPLELQVERLEEQIERLEEQVEMALEKPVEKPAEETVEETVEKQVEETVEKPAEETEKKDEDEKEKTVPCSEVEKRVSGMQAKMQRQVNDFKAQLELKEKELTKAQARITSLSEELYKIKAELSETASALESKRNALATLNAGVLSPAETLPSMQDGLARCKTPAEKVAFIKSGKYVKN